MKQHSLLIAIILLSFTLSCRQKEATIENTPKASGKFLMISDIHFNPFCYPEIVPQLNNADYTEWQQIFESKNDSSYGVFGQDTYYRLLARGLKAMQAHNSKPDMIVINGDFLSHNFGDVYQQMTGQTNEDSFRLFVDKTISFVFMMLDKHFPDVPILPVLGNNDDYCGDYHIQPEGPFLSFFASQTQPLLRDMKQYDYNSTFSKGGYYKVAMPWDSTTVFIGLNTIFLSHKYANQCNPGDTVNAGWEEMEWLRNTLEECAANNKKVWLSFHIPPGMDIYSSMKKDPCSTDNTVTMWHPQYNDSFIALVNRYNKVIKGNFGGHTHMDEFRLVADGNKLTSFVHITPSISPIFGNNPAFVEVTWAPDKMELLNSVTYRFKGIETTGKDVWTEEYNYDKIYGIKHIDEKSLGKLWDEMGKDTTLLNDYLRYYFVDEPAKYPSPGRAYWCGARYLTPESFIKCSCTKD